MNGIIGGDDKSKKKPFYSNARRHYNKPSGSFSMNRWQKRVPRNLLIAVGLVVFIIYIVFIKRSNSQQPIKLRNQPIYSTHDNTCTAKLCNPANKCSTWKPNKKYSWTDLSSASIFRDLHSVRLSPGCELNVKVDEDEWIVIPEGYSECRESGYGFNCRNLIDIDFKENILIKANQMKKIIEDSSSKSQEIVLVQHANNESQNQLDVTMITQFSVNRLETFKSAINVWSGPLSIAIYLTNPNDIDELIEFFKVKENLAAYSRATISLVKPNYLDSSHLSYPINHLRNIAITESTTEYILVIDADFIPSNNLYRYIRSELMPYIVYQSTSMPRTAWVVPCFAMLEAFNDLPLPQSYDELRRLIGQGIAYITDPGAGHGPTLAVEVAMVRPLLNGNTLAYEVCYESQWEPYYVVHRSAPLYDARFRNQGGDKQSHALQLNAEKYRFMVLRDVFMVHRDHSKLVWPGGGFEKTQKESTNWNYFEDFMREIKELYGGNVRWPRGCSAGAIGWQEQRRDTLGLAVGAA